MPPEGFGGGEFNEGEFSGPGGCTSSEECTSYCQTHPEECREMMDEFEPPEGFGIPEGFDAPEGLQPPEGFEMPEGCLSPEECMKLFGETQKYEGDEGYTGYEGYLDSEGFGKDETHQDPRDLEPDWQTQPDQNPAALDIQPEWDKDEFDHIEPTFEVSPESLFITPSIDAPTFEGGAESHSLNEQPNATFVESVKTFFRNVLTQ